MALKLVDVGELLINWPNEYLSTGLVQANDMSNLILALCGDTMCFLVGLYLAMYLSLLIFALLVFHFLYKELFW